MRHDFAAVFVGVAYGGNYGIVGNGYFATWLSLVFSTILVIVGVPPIASALEPVFGSLDDCKKMMLGVPPRSSHLVPSIPCQCLNQIEWSANVTNVVFAADLSCLYH